MRNTDTPKYQSLAKKAWILLLALYSFIPMSYATFTLSGTTITQSGTDTNLDALSGITGVTFIESGTGAGIRRVYLLPSATIFLVNGTLTIDPELEEIVLREDVGTNGFMVSSTGTLNISGKRTINGQDFYSTRRWLSAPRDANYPASGVRFQNGSTINWEGGEVFYRSGFIIDAGANLNITNGIIDGGGSTTGGGQIRNSSTALDVNGLIAKRHLFTHLATPTRFDGYVALQAAQAHGWSSGSPNQTITLRDYSGKQGNTQDVAMWAGTRLEFINSVTGTDLIVGPNVSGNATSYGFVHVQKEVVINPRTLVGAAINDVVVFVHDTANGNRETYSQEGHTLDATADKTYTATTTGGTGTPTMTIDVGFNIVNTGNSDANNTGNYAWDFRGKNNDNTDLFDFHLWSYLHTYSSTEVELKGSGIKTVTPLLISDPNVSETNKATVLAYTSIDNLDQLYDRSKAWKVDNVGLEYPTISTQLAGTDGSIINLGNRNLVVDATAASAFAVNTTTNTITIKASTLAAGTKFTGLTTTGTVSTTNGATLEFGYSHSGGRVKYVEIRGLTNSNITVTDNVPATPASLASSTAFTGDYKASFNAPTDESNTQIFVSRTAFTSFAQLFPQTSLSFIIEPLQLPSEGLEKNQAIMINNSLKLLQKTEAILNTYKSTPSATLTVNTTATTNTGTASEANQDKIMDLLNRVLSKVTAIREVVKQ